MVDIELLVQDQGKVQYILTFKGFFNLRYLGPWAQILNVIRNENYVIGFRGKWIRKF